MKNSLPFILVTLFIFSVGGYYYYKVRNITQNEPQTSNTSKENQVGLPIKDALERVTKKPFGKYVTPENSPVSPERFTGFHAGTDFEVRPEEINIPVAVDAICDGEIIRKQEVTGYGGVIIQACEIENQQVTVLYGHLNIFDASAKLLGTNLKKGEFIANLGADKSEQTAGERKHLHLSIHRGAEIDYRGYVQNEAELANWFDFEKLL